jgi:predicted NAD/FAD-dependent oxidoreductase
MDVPKRRASEMRVGIVGAGMAGLSCADALVAQGHHVELYDKARGPGGRMSTRRIATPLGEASFDHGAQYFTVRDPDFGRVVADWSARGLAEPWCGGGPDAWVGVPAMNAVVRDMAARHDTRFGQLVRGVIHDGARWRLLCPDVDAAEFDAVVIALPAEQAASLLGAADLDMARQATLARSQPCWTGMFAFAVPIATDKLVLRNQGLIGWAARNTAKPSRCGPEAWVVQAHGSWSAEHLETAPGEIESAMVQALGEALSVKLPPPIASSMHRWRYALSRGLGDGALWNSDIGLGACGDWLLGPRVECAWLSGKALAEAMTTTKSKLLAL